MERWGKTFKEPDEPPPRHSALDWDNFGPSSPQQQRRSKPAGQAGSDDAASASALYYSASAGMGIGAFADMMSGSMGSIGSSSRLLPIAAQPT